MLGKKRRHASASSSSSQAATKKAKKDDARVKRGRVSDSHLGMQYTFPLAALPSSEWKAHRAALTFAPKNSFADRNPFMKAPPPVRLFGERQGYAIVPGPYGLQWFGEPEKDEQSTGDPWPQAVGENGSAIQLWGQDDSFDQKKLLACVQKHWEAGRGLQFEAPTSAGKTAMACYLMQRFRVKTLVVVPGSTLLNQWPARLRQFLPGVKVGIMQGKRKFEHEGCHVVVAMLRSLAMCGYPREPFDSFGFLVLDEVHTAATRTYIKALNTVGKIKRKLGVTATFDRNDGMEVVLKATVGPLVFRAPKDTVASRQTVVRPVLYTGGNRNTVMVNGEVDHPRTLNALVEDDGRTRAQIQYLARLFREGRRIVVLADRVSHLERLHAALSAAFPDLTLFHYRDSTKKTKRSHVDASAHDGLFASYGLFGLGTDITYVDTLFLATGRRSVEQPVGRLRAVCKIEGVERKPLLIVDWVDCFEPYQAQYNGSGRRSRRKTYRMKKFKWDPPEEIS